ncbi:MAG TPA: hypothetical protein PLR25_12150 [Planctomycetaceae bacterium]|nr:hypothetical protein [Planctomycetaceae bacterium]
MDLLQVAANADYAGTGKFEPGWNIVIQANGFAAKFFVGYAEPNLLRALLRDGHLRSLGRLRRAR